MRSADESSKQFGLRHGSEVKWPDNSFLAKWAVWFSMGDVFGLSYFLWAGLLLLLLLALVFVAELWLLKLIWLLSPLLLLLLNEKDNALWSLTLWWPFKLPLLLLFVPIMLLWRKGLKFAFSFEFDVLPLLLLFRGIIWLFMDEAVASIKSLSLLKLLSLAKLLVKLLLMSVAPFESNCCCWNCWGMLLLALNDSENVLGLRNSKSIVEQLLKRLRIILFR